MQRKIVLACLTLFIATLAIPGANINKAHAFLGSANSVSVSNVTTNFSSPSGVGSGTVAQGGSSITVTVTVQASGFMNPAYQRNVTIGFLGDWMTVYQNASILNLQTSAIAYTTITVALPSVNAISPGHFWNVQVWDGPASGNVASCTPGNAENYAGSGTAKSCFSLGSGFVSILTGDQYAAAQGRNTANTILNAVSATSSAGRAQVDQATAELSLGDQAWRGGDFSGAKSHYQNAQSDANAALATDYNLGGGQANAGIVSIIESGTGILLFGLGGLLAGIGGFFYLKRKPKA